ncbi:hypothetical protein ACHHYP_13574 [Achlya hypogyna]|uniref:Myb-like domain-containing protein n=1 Tax=Achlya hypogyna TaxID=1202772 RepID=A0A1V9YF40_ACHHY|nr:hypothetical protein ACHHYP_13574 [Achlya hypogyna]
MSDEPTMKSKKPVFRFSVPVDIDLIKVVISLSPHNAPYGQMAARWEEVGAQMRDIHGDHISAGGCRKRFDDLASAFKTNNIKALRATGTEEQLLHRDQLLQEVTDLMHLAAENKKRGKKDKSTKQDDREHEDHGMRTAALATLKRSNCVGAVEAPSEAEEDTPPQKKTKNDVEDGLGASATTEVASIVACFTAMMEKTNKMKEQELDVKRQEIALSERKLELDYSRYLLDKAEREARFQLEKVEREAHVEFIRSAIEMMRSANDK